MKKLLTLMSLTVMATGAMAQQAKTKPQFIIKDEIRLSCPPVQDQGSSGTCWCFSTTSFLESEMMANGNPNPPNLSEMFIVKNNYIDHGQKYVMLEGNLTFGEGSYFLDNIMVAKKYGLMPESAFPNKRPEEKSISHSKIINMAKQFCDSVAHIKSTKINPNWINDYKTKLSSYFADEPATFEYEGRTYTAKSFADSVVRLNLDDYIQVTSFSHHEFGKFISLEIPDNWRWGKFLNLPIDDLIAIMDSTLANGHTILWASDVSENGFDTYSTGVAALPGIQSQDSKTIEEYKKLEPDQQLLRSRKLNGAGVEMSVTQQSRQEGFMNKTTTDDHGMHIIGSAKDQLGNEYYIVKNSWGNTGKYNGYFYASKNYVKAKTTGIMVHKSACAKYLESATWE